MSTKPFFTELEQRLTKVQEKDRRDKRTEEVLLKRDEEYRNLFDSIPDPVTIIQENQSVLLNKEFTRVLGYDHHDIEKGLRPSDMVVGDKDKEITQERIEKRFAGKKEVSIRSIFTFLSFSYII